MERAGHHGELAQLGQWLDAGDDGDGDAHLTCPLYEGKVFLVVKKQLGHGILCAQILLLFQILHVHLQIGSLLVLLRIAGHADVKLAARILDGGAVGKETLIEPLHLTNEVSGMSMAAGCRLEHRVFLRLVTA